MTYYITIRQGSKIRIIAGSLKELIMQSSCLLERANITAWPKTVTQLVKNLNYYIEITQPDSPVRYYRSNYEEVKYYLAGHYRVFEEVDKWKN